MRKENKKSMIKYINDSNKRLEELLAFSLGIMNGEDGKLLIEKYKEAIENITPHDMLKIEDKQMQMGISPREIKKDVEKVKWEKPREGSFLYYLILENEAFEFKLNQIKKMVRSYKGREESDFIELKEDLHTRFIEFQSFDFHYIKKENILFPYLEEHWENHRPLKVMWSLHDDIRKSLKNLIGILDDSNSQWKDFNPLLGKHFSLVFRMIQKENLIIFPVATETINEEEWLQMHMMSFEYPFPFIEAPQKPQEEKPRERIEESVLAGAKMMVSETGNLSLDQALLIFNQLPVDITVLDENDKVLFFNKAKERFFPRSPAIIGRSVQNCHPPESVHVVEKIVEAFRQGEKDKAEFWIQMKGRFILIQYFALRNEKGEHEGVIEASQDVTDIRNLKGEQRLLNLK